MKNKEISILKLSYGNYVSLDDYLDLQHQLEEKEKIIDEITDYINNEKFKDRFYPLKDILEIIKGVKDE